MSAIRSPRILPSLVASVLLALPLADPAGAQVTGPNLLTNGDFEATPTLPLHSTGSVPGGEIQDYFGGRYYVEDQYVPGWTVADPRVANLYRAPMAYGFFPSTAASGQQYMALNWSPLAGVVLDNAIRQDFVLPDWATGFAFSTFMSTETGYTASPLMVSIYQGASLVGSSGGLFNDAGNGLWDLQTWSGALTPGAYTLELRGIGMGNAWDVVVDDVRLVATGTPTSTVPEPSTWALLAGGLAALGLTTRRRQTST